MKKQMLVLLVGLLALMLAACGSPSSAQPAASSSSGKKFDPRQWVGTYKGTWTNQVTNATGPATVTLSVDEAKKEATVVVDMDGPYLGLVEAPPQTFVAKYDDTMAKLVGKNVLFGDYSITIDPDGKIVGTFKNLAGGVVPEMSYTGQLGNGKLDSDYTVKFADGKTATSILRTTKQ
jgi:ABC-type Fe3+-hydroxamate transport system substrate-binding protein